MVFTELLPGSPPPAAPVVPVELYHLTNGTRSYPMIVQLQEHETDFGYLDDPDDVRWILSLEQWNKGTGFMVVYLTDRSNVATSVGHALFGYQDTVRTIINRSRSHVEDIDPPLNLTPIIEA